MILSILSMMGLWMHVSHSIVHERPAPLPPPPPSPHKQSPLVVNAPTDLVDPSNKIASVPIYDSASQLQPPRTVPEVPQTNSMLRGNAIVDEPERVPKATPKWEEDDESYFVVFSTGCSEFQDWQSIGVYSSAEAVNQRGIIVRIASGCKPDQEEAIRHSVSHLPDRCRVHFAPNTQVEDHTGRIYKYANKPLGMMHWLLHADPPVPPTATVALIDPDMFFLRPLWHDSFDSTEKYIATGPATSPPVPHRMEKGTMVAQQYGIGGAPWKSGKNGGNQKAWGLKDFFTNEAGRPSSPALDADINERTAGRWYSIGAPYIALASDWLPIATNWTNLMPMAVERSFGNLAEMYAMVIAVADLGIRPARVDHLMVSNVQAGGEGWPWVDKLPMDRGCDPTILTDPSFRLPTFLHYCQRYEIENLKAEALAQGFGGSGANQNSGPTDARGSYWMYTKYQVPDEILHCPAGSTAAEGVKAPAKRSKGNMKLVGDGFLPEPSPLLVANSRKDLRGIFSHCAATRATNQAARDYRRWFCDAQ